ncbi:MAG TPA: hypothetical protein VFY71_00310 [Planctomycetota bacterium]|nr:hypothetical protein [Planctomycetota bacterium]
MRAPTNGEGTARGPWLLAALLGGAVAGTVCGVMLVVLGEREAAQAAPARGGDEALVRELRTLATELATLRDELERTRLAAGSAPSAATAPSALAPGPATPDIAGLSAALTAALDRLAQQLGARSPGLLPPQVDTVKRKQLAPVYDPNDTAPGHDGDDWDAQHEQSLQQHLLWTCSQVLDAYGRPDAVYPGENGKVVWVYELSPDNDVNFTFVDGYVTYVH